MSAPTFRALLLLLYGTGMRIGEALRLRGGDVDLGNGILTVRGTKFYKVATGSARADVHAHLRVYLALPGRVDRDDEPLFQSRLQQAGSTSGWLKSASGSCATLRAFAGKRAAPISPASTIFGTPSRSTG